ncbi:MAG: VanZ family protein [Abitibacteriaceae bacterium]|nr:VanZ family protein [Abditibacteriaceae bacterium]
MPRRSNLIGLMTSVWAIIIFATSCTFIERRVFINFVKRFIPAGMPQQLWVSFWSAFGIFVVKAYHISEYALLSYLLYLTLYRQWGKTRGRAMLSSAIIALLFAASDEWHQTFVPGRGGTWVDVVIDSVGIGLTTLYVLWRQAQSEV